jgi:hypothetical protein
MADLINYVDELIQEVGPRPAGTRAEHQASELIAGRFLDLGLSVKSEEFNCTRNASWALLSELVLALLAAYLIFFQPALGALAFVLALLSAVLFILDLLDRNPLASLLNKNLSQNVVARYVPFESEAAGRKRKVVIVAHYDSQRTALQAAPLLVNLVPALRLVVRVAVIGVAVVALLLLFPFPELPRFILSVIGLVLGIVVLVTLLCAIINLFMPYNQGANSNGSGVAVLLGVANRLIASPDQEAPQGRRRGRSRDAENGDAALSRRRESGRVKKTARRSDSPVVAPIENLSPTPDRRVSLRSSRLPDAEEVPSSPEASLPEAQTPSPGRIEDATQDLGLKRGDDASESAFAYEEAVVDQEEAPDVVPAELRVQSVGDNLAASPFIRTRQPIVKDEDQEAELEEKRRRVAQYGGTATNADGTPSWYTKAKEKAEAKQKNAEASQKDGDEQNVVRSQYADVPTPTHIRMDAGGTAGIATSALAADAESVAAETLIETPEAEEPMVMAGVEPTTAASDEELAITARRQSSTTRVVKPVQQNDFSGIDRSAFQVLQGSGEGDSPVVVPTPPAEDISVDEEKVDDILTEARAASDSSTGQRLFGRRDPREKLRDLPSMSGVISEMIPAQQAGLDTSSLSEEDKFRPDTDSMVNLTGSFTPLSATGVIKPIGEELLEYSREDEIYVPDADDSSIIESYTESGSYAGPDRVTMPESRLKSFFGNMGDKLSGSSKKRDKFKDSPSDWIGVDKDYDARKNGSAIGSWEKFSDEEEDGWNGGAFGGRNNKENVEAMMRISEELLDKEVWLVGIGAAGSRNAGMKAFLKANAADLRGALIINVDGVGAGSLVFSRTEGTFRRSHTDHRLQNLASTAANTLGLPISPFEFKGYTTDAAVALTAGARAISLLGIDGKLPAGWRWAKDTVGILREESLQDAVEIVLEMVKNS